jgi:hypothetical protein
VVYIMKTCRRCEQTKPLTEYSRKAASKDGHQPLCKCCATTEHLEWNRKNPEKVREYAKRQRAKDPAKFKRKQNRAMLKYRHGLTPEDKMTMFEAQEGGCSICGDAMEVESKSCHVDHDHSTGKLRGLLCRECNRGLGAFRDNVESLEAAINYLERAQC